MSVYVFLKIFKDVLDQVILEKGKQQSHVRQLK